MVGLGLAHSGLVVAVVEAHEDVTLADKVSFLDFIGVDAPGHAHADGNVAIARDHVPGAGEHRSGRWRAGTGELSKGHLYYGRPTECGPIKPQAGATNDQRKHEDEPNPPDLIAALGLPDRGVDTQAVEAGVQTGLWFAGHRGSDQLRPA